MTRKWTLGLLVLAIFAACGAFFLWPLFFPPPVSYLSEKATKGQITEEVTAHGNLQPLAVVKVGAQVNGRILRLFADYNSRVQEGEVLAVIDPANYDASLRQAQAQLAQAQAQVALASVSYGRIEAVYRQDYASRQELDQAKEELDAALALRDEHQAAVRRARTDLDYTVIRSPVNGVVVARKIDVGQTVVSSFQTPELFEIARDLSQMQIEAQVTEADIVGITPGQRARFSVDAWPDEEFFGTVKQVRLSATIEQGVVSYTVVVEVKNPDFRLLPGMSAYVHIARKTLDKALLVPAAALRFTPPGQTKEEGKNIVWVMAEGRPEAREVVIGVSDASRVEIKHGLQEGEEVLVGVKASPSKKSRFRFGGW